MIFLGTLFDRKQEFEIKKNNKLAMQNAANTYQWALIDGLLKYLPYLSIYNVLPVGVFPHQYRKLFLHIKYWNYKHSDNVEIGCINLPFIKQHMRYKKIKKTLQQKEDKHILIYSTYLPFLKAVQNLDDSYHVSLIVTDLPEFYDLDKVSFLRKCFRQRNNKKIMSLLKRMDSFVLLTEQMKKPLGVGDRPYVVVEGINSLEDIPTEIKPTNKKIILYTGTLHYQFGISNLLKAFSLIEGDEYKLWVCGSGEAEDEIKVLADSDSRVEFYGYITKEETLQLQSKATVLVNPRQNVGEYTKYSFPSKTMEYMASGVPVVMYKLDGIPDEYDAYLHYVGKDLSPLALANKLREICEMSKQVRSEFGAKARSFILKEKNSKVQAKKVVDIVFDNVLNL